jgi:molecular chaperone HtpG
MGTGVETFEFQAEARQLLDLMVHSIYSNKDIFLRELISNSSDALDRRRFEAISNPELLPEGTEPHIRIEADSKARTVSVSDNGIGMTRDEVVQLIGTIAKSGTREFTARLQEARKEGFSPEMIGQFGVGFYSTFMVADAVTLTTRRAGETTATRWHSDGQGTYTLEETERDEPGTTVVCHLKEADDEDALHDYAQEWRIREIVKRYSDFVAYPIRMRVERKVVERDADGKPVEGAEEKTEVTDETLNSMKAIWLRDPSEVTEEELNEFYRHISHDWNPPLRTIRANIEGTLMYRLLLFIPSKAPFDLYVRDGRRGVQLYVKRVFIMDDCEELLPDYLRFLRGVVDSEDLSLNISREILQQNRQIQRMQRGVVGKVLNSLKQMKQNEDEQYRNFWNEFGQVLKEGLFQDPDSRDDLLGLALFRSTLEDGLTGLQGYVDRMKDGQDAIYYMTGESLDAVQSSPHLEAFREKGYEVLLLTDRVDEVWTQSVNEFQGKKLQSVGKGRVDLGTDEEKRQAEEQRKQAQTEHASLLECIQKRLEDHVKEVRLSSRLTSSPACLVTDEGDMSPQLEALLKAANQAVPEVKRILEINPSHPLLEKLQHLYDTNREDPLLGDYAQLLHGQALLAEGGELPNPAAYSKLVGDLMLRAL